MKVLGAWSTENLHKSHLAGGCEGNQWLSHRFPSQNNPLPNGFWRWHVGLVDYDQIHRHAEQNYGLIDRDRVLEAGGTDNHIRTRLEHRQWQQVHAGVYLVGSAPLTWHAELRAATLAAGSRSVVSHRTAAELWGLEGVSFPRIEITVPYLSRPVPQSILVHRTRRPMKPTEFEAIPVTTAERAILDTAWVMPTPTIETLYDSGIRKGIITPGSMADCVFEDGKRGVKGRNKVLRVLDARRLGSAPGSHAETATLRLIRGRGFEEPERQFPIVLSDGSVAIVDFAWPLRVKVIEIDGLVAHATARQLENDLNRQNLILEAGWQLRRFPARMVLKHPQQVGDEISRFLSS